MIQDNSDFFFGVSAQAGMFEVLGKGYITKSHL